MMDDTWISAATWAYESVGEANPDEQAVDRLAGLIAEASGMTHADRMDVAMTECMGTERDAFLDWVWDSAEYCTGCGDPIANDDEACACYEA